jgi:hypothetical protein
VPTGPIAWPPGDYYLEATVTYTGGNGTERDLYSAELSVQPDQTLRLDSHQGVCEDPTPPQVQRDAERRVRTFRCGIVTYELRPGSDTVTGDLLATVQEGYTITECMLRGPTGVCERSTTVVSTRPVNKEARLRVRRQSP